MQVRWVKVEYTEEHRVDRLQADGISVGHVRQDIGQDGNRFHAFFGADYLGKAISWEEGRRLVEAKLPDPSAGAP
jgi:hypothetical protein